MNFKKAKVITEKKVKQAVEMREGVDCDCACAAAD